MPKTKRVAVIMAGGAGERFWPLSRQSRPKQLLRLANRDDTLLAQAVARLLPLIEAGDIYVATAEHLVDVIREAQVGVPDENVIAEPFKRNTSGCLAYATAHILAKYGSGVDGVGKELSMAVVTADHTVGDDEAFRATVAAILDAAETKQALATIGIVPTRPETGYGYIQLPENAGAIPICPVASFCEKPDEPRAKEFVASGRYLWNSGMFFWNVAVFMEELGQARPQLAQAILRMAEAMRLRDGEAVRRIFEGLDNISIDHALMEHARRVIVTRATFDWDDIGAWPALDRTHDHDENGNVILGDPVTVDCKNCIIYKDCGENSPDITVAVLGTEDLVVVVSDNAVLVTRKDRAQDVRKIVEELKRRDARGGGRGGAAEAAPELSTMSKTSTMSTAEIFSSEAAAATPHKSVEGAPTVLVVDDEESIREIVALTLESLGFQVLAARDGSEGVEVFKAHADEIVAVLLDMTMPRLNGEQVFAELIKIRPDIRVILSSGYDEQDAANRLWEKGLAGFIRKPYPPSELVAELKKVLGML